MISFIGSINVYTSIGFVTGKIFKRTCSAGNCTKHYDGYEGSLFLLSSTKACGHEIGWEYEDQVMTSHQTFTGFCKTLNTRYIRSNSLGRFLSPAVFIKWWFGWTSSMRIDFREICEMCDGNIDYLACDGTKSGMGVGQAFITPIEQHINTPQIKSPSKRYDRTFLTDDICSLSQRRKEMNDYLLYLAKIVLNELPTNEKLNAEIGHYQNATLVSLKEQSRYFFNMYMVMVCMVLSRILSRSFADC